MRFALLSFCLLLGTAAVGAAEEASREDALAPLIESLGYSAVTQTDARSLIVWFDTAAEDAPRWEAIELLGLRGDREAIPRLRRFAADAKKPFLAETAAIALARLGDEGSKRALFSLLKRAKAPERRVFLAARLAEVGDASGFRVVARATVDRSAIVRFATVEALVAFLPLEPASKGAIDAGRRLLVLAHDESADVRREFVARAPIAIARGGNREQFEAALRGAAKDDGDLEIREPAKPKLTGRAASVGASDKYLPELVESLERSGVRETDTRSLITWLSTAPEDSPRCSAVELLGMRGDREAIPVLRTFVANEYPYLAESAALALARLEDPSGRSALVSLLRRSKIPERQVELAGDLAELGDASCFRYVAQATVHGSAFLRRASVDVLVAFLPFEPASNGAIDAERRLLALAHDEEAAVRIGFAAQAAQAIARGGNRKKFSAALRRMAKHDANLDLRASAKWHLAKLKMGPPV